MREALLDSEQQFRALIENAQDAIVIVNPDITIRYESPSMERMTGREADDRIGKNPFDFCHPDDITNVAETFLQLLENKIAIAHTELRLQHKNGRWLTFEVIGTNLIDDPAVAGIVLNLRDITERKQAEEALRESEERFRALTESTSDWVWEVDLDGVYTYASPKVKDLLGYEPEEILGKTPFDLMPQEEAKRVEEEFRASVEAQSPFAGLENTNMHKDGRLIVLETSGVPIRSDDGRLCGYRGIDRDITERKRAEEALRESEDRYRILVETMNDGLAAQDIDGTFTYVNDRLCEMLGFSRDELIGVHLVDFLDEVSRNKYKEEMSSRHAGERVPYEIEFTRKDGAKIISRVSPQLITDQEGNIVGSFGVATDITDLKRADEALRESEELLRAFMESATDVYTIFNSKLELLDVSEKGTKAFLPNATREDMIGKHITEIAPDIKKTGRYQDYLNVIKTGKPFQVDDTILHAKFAVRHVSLKAFKVGDGMGLVITDITERKRAEEELIRLSNAVRMSTDSIVISDLEARIVDVNEATLRMYGTDDKGDLVEKNSFDLIAPEDREKALAGAKEVLERGYAENQEYHITTKDGSTVLVAMDTAIMKDADGKPTGFVAVSRDITERMRMEQSLRDSEEKIRNLFESVADGIVAIDLNGVYTEVNEKLLEMMGFSSKDEILGKNAFEFVAPRDVDRATVEMQRALEQESIARLEYTVVRTDGSEYPAEVNATVLKDASGNPVGFIASIRDIAERKRAEQALRESEEFSSSLLNNAPNPVLVINPDTSVRYVNPALEKLTGFSSAELVNRKTPYPWWTEETLEKTSKELEEAMSKGAERLEVLFQKKNGERFWVEITSRPIRRQGELDHYLSNWVDITERKRAEEKLRHYSERLRVMAMQLSAAEDNERRRLAQELHDQVGQNLTALSINLSMVLTQLPDESVAPVRSIVDDSQSILEQTAKIIRDVMANLQPPVLEDYGLVAALRWYAERFASRTGISVTVQGEDPSPRLNTSSENTLFRIAQETLTNAAKHAQATQVTVTLAAETKTVRLVVTDDGIGFNIEDVVNSDVQKGWGLTTMSERAKNLGGSFDIESRPGHGTRVVVEIGR